MSSVAEIKLPGLDCGLCGYPSCESMAAQLEAKPELIKRCIPRSADSLGVTASPVAAPFMGPAASERASAVCAESPDGSCSSCSSVPTADGSKTGAPSASDSAAGWSDVLGREFDFVLDHFPEEVGPREQVILHNPMITREMDIQPGEVPSAGRSGSAAAAR
jgi:hypothetical protein